MPIYDQGYQRWKGELQRHPVRWWPIVRHGVQSVIKQRKYLLLMVLAWTGPFVQGVRLFLGSRVSGVINTEQLGGLFADGMDFYLGMLEKQGLFVLLFVVLVGSDLIAQDRRHNALQIYFSKPLTPNDYILGKLGIVGTFLMGITWVPVLLLWLFALTLQIRTDYFSAVWSVPLVATVFCVLQLLVAGLLILALSAVGKRAIFVGVSWILLFGYGPLQGIIPLVQGLSGNDLWGLLHVSGNLQHVGEWLFGLPGHGDYHPLASLAMLGLVTALSYVVLRRKIRPVEVVL